jgi:DnaJ family protein C protein 19
MILFVAHLKATKAVITGLGLAIIGYAGRYIIKKLPNISEKMAETLKNMPQINSQVNMLHY